MSVQPFADSALELARHGLVVIPLGGDDGKKPLVGGFNKWRGQRPETVERFANKFPFANIGIVHGQSSRTMVVDVDAPAQIAAALSRFGDTPIMVETPRGGAHLFYRFAGERCADLRSDGLEADIKAKGGITTAPPSVRPSGRYEGRPYSLTRGTWADLDRLPPINPGSLPQHSLSIEQPIAKHKLRTPAQSGRNNTLFRDCLRAARQCDCLDGLLEHACMRNRKFIPPLSGSEVAQVASNAWRLECDGKNRMGGTPEFIAPFSSMAKLRGLHGSLDLYSLLKETHDGFEVPFAISPKGMAQANLIHGWKRRRYEVARDHLMECGFIGLVHKGGRQRGDTDLFVLLK